MKKLAALLAVLAGLTMTSVQAACPLGSKCPVKESKPCTVCETPCPPVCETPCPKDCDFVFDKPFCELKSKLDLSANQTCEADNLFSAFKSDVHNYCEEIRCEKRELCQLAKDNASNADLREQNRAVKDTYKKIKTRAKEFRADWKCTLDKCQIKTYNKEMRCEKKRYKKVKKYCPCFCCH